MKFFAFAWHCFNHFASLAFSADPDPANIERASSMTPAMVFLDLASMFAASSAKTDRNAAWSAAVSS